MFVLCLFFFSSRRRHTRYWRDWSSDVCSSDLDRVLRLWQGVSEPHPGWGWIRGWGGVRADRARPAALWEQQWAGDPRLAGRSEERRVGKECRSRWEADG